MQTQLHCQKLPALTLLSIGILTLLVSCGDGSTGSSTSTGVTANTIALSASPSIIPTDNSLPTTVTLQALNASNAAVPNAIVTLGADSGFLSASTVTTDSAGMATFNFSAGITNQSNRTATITATAGGTTQLPVQIVGSTLTASQASASIPDDGLSPATLIFTANDSSSNPIDGAAFTVSASGTGGVTLTPSSGTTDSAGKFTVTVAGASPGAVTVTADAVGSTAAVSITVSSTGSTFGISQTILNGTVTTLNPTAVSMQIGDTLQVDVTAPAPTTQVVFASSQGTWVGGLNFIVVPVAGTTASATLTTSTAGVDNVQVYASSTLSDTLTVAMTADTPNSITVQAVPSVVTKSVGTTTGVSTLIARVLDAGNQPVGDVPVAFSIVNPTGGGETLSPVVVFTASTPGGGLSVGEARTSFTSGSLSSSALGIKIHAEVLGTAVETEVTGANATDSGNDAVVIIGGSAASVGFGSATELSENATKTNYIQAMSVLVTDSGGNPVPQTVVSLSIWPIAWSTGSGCTPDSDDGATKGTFLNEDVNENLVLDTTEDGTRDYYSGAAAPTGTGRVDNLITPPNSAAGTVPMTVTTGTNGVATFDLEYGKNSALWIVSRLRAQTAVQGTDAIGEIAFRLPATEEDVNLPDVCRLPPSPYLF